MLQISRKEKKSGSWDENTLDFYWIVYKSISKKQNTITNFNKSKAKRYLFTLGTVLDNLEVEVFGQNLSAVCLCLGEIVEIGKARDAKRGLFKIRNFSSNLPNLDPNHYFTWAIWLVISDPIFKSKSTVDDIFKIVIMVNRRLVGFDSRHGWCSPSIMGLPHRRRNCNGHRSWLIRAVVQVGLVEMEIRDEEGFVGIKRGKAMRWREGNK